MKETTIKILAGVCVLMAFAFVIVFSEMGHYRSEAERLSNNQTALRKDLQAYRLKDSSSVAEIETLQMTKKEFKTLCERQQKEITDLNIKLRYLQSISTADLSHEYVFDTIRLYDSVFISNDIDTIKCFKYADNYINLKGCVDKDAVTNLNIKSYDTITTVVSKKYRKKFLFFKWRPYYNVTLRSKNPYSEIRTAEYVEIK